MGELNLLIRMPNAAYFMRPGDFGEPIVQRFPFFIQVFGTSQSKTVVIALITPHTWFALKISEI